MTKSQATRKVAHALAKLATARRITKEAEAELRVILRQVEHETNQLGQSGRGARLTTARFRERDAGDAE